MRDPEVDDDRIPIKKKDIRGFEVSVDDAGGVDRVQSIREPTTQPQQGIARQWPALGHDPVERGTGDVPGDDVGPGPFGVGIENGRHPGVLHPGQRLDLTRQAAARLTVVSDVLAQDLDGHRSPGLGQRQVHDTHAALAELFDQPIGADPLSANRHDRARVVIAPQPRRHGPTVCRDGCFRAQERALRGLLLDREDYCWM